MAKNTHLEHLEDDILNNGSEGGKNAIVFLRELGKMLTEPTSQVRVTTNGTVLLLLFVERIQKQDCFLLEQNLFLLKLLQRSAIFQIW
jgi:hypothetical protein